MQRIILALAIVALFATGMACATVQKTAETGATTSPVPFATSTPNVMPSLIPRTYTPIPTVPPGEDNLCLNPPLPERAIGLALRDEGLVLEIVTPLDYYDRDTGIRVRVEGVVEGASAPPERVVDIRSIFSCRAGRLWAPLAPVLAMLRINVEGVNSVAGWPVLAADGGPFDPAELGAGGSADQLIVVLDDGERVTVAELMQRGRDFVEPTPTPGSRTPSRLTEADAGGVTAPDTGTGASSGSGGAPWAAIGVGALLVAMVAAGLYGLRRGRRV